MIELTIEQQQALACAEVPLTLIDPATHQSYVLIKRETFIRFKSILDEDDARLMAHLIADADPGKRKRVGSRLGLPTTPNPLFVL